MACFLVFLAGLRHLIRQARTDGEWASTLVFGVGLVFATLTLFGDALAAGAALDTVGGKPEPVVVRALWEGSIPAFGAIGLIIMALRMASAGYAILATRALPRWTGWVASASATGFYTADGLVSLLSELPFLLWALAASISMIVVKREALASTPAYAG